MLGLFVRKKYGVIHAGNIPLKKFGQFPGSWASVIQASCAMGREDLPSHFPLNVAIFHLVNNPCKIHGALGDDIRMKEKHYRFQRLFNFRSGFS